MFFLKSFELNFMLRSFRMSTRLDAFWIYETREVIYISHLDQCPHPRVTTSTNHFSQKPFAPSSALSWTPVLLISCNRWPTSSCAGSSINLCLGDAPRVVTEDRTKVQIGVLAIDRRLTDVFASPLLRFIHSRLLGPTPLPTLPPLSQPPPPLCFQRGLLKSKRLHNSSHSEQPRSTEWPLKLRVGFPLSCFSWYSSTDLTHFSAPHCTALRCAPPMNSQPN